ncbi:MAG: hypothetical protein PHG73_08065 [Pygmaiobacter sp.]|jgi:hypothetical protein|nr:hypothetical protein [Pygmaiobacter sp.]
MSFWFFNQALGSMGFFARGVAGIGVLVWAYFYSNKAPKLKKALIILCCVFGALLLLRLLFSILSLWTGWALYPYFSVPHQYYWG